MQLVCKYEHDRETRLNVEFVVRNGRYDRLFAREFNVQTKAELLAILPLLAVSIASVFEEVESPVEAEEAPVDEEGVTL